MQIINLLVNAGLQVLLFAMIPFVWWFIFAREQKNFFIWLGFKKTMIQNKLKYLDLFLTISAILIFPSLLAVTFFIDKSTMATRARDICSHSSFNIFLFSNRIVRRTVF